MQVHKVQNKTSFKGFEFKNPHAQKVFEDKLNHTYKLTAEEIKEYMAKTAKEPNKVFINATKSRMNYTGEYLLFATFSNSNGFIADSSLSSNSLKNFIRRCAAEAGYKLPESKSFNPAQIFLNQVEKIVDIIK